MTPKYLEFPDFEYKPHQLTLKRMGIDTHQELVIYMRRDCYICRSEGFEALSRLRVYTQTAKIIATLNVVDGELLSENEVGLSEAAWQLLNPRPGEKATLIHTKPIPSFSFIRQKLFGTRLNKADMQCIITDIAQGRYTPIHMSAFISACIGNQLDTDEMIFLTQAMVQAGDVLNWDTDIVVDKHCIGGLPGNRTTPIIVSIVAANGLIMPKTSSRAITSPAGTSDAVEVVTPVNLDIHLLKKVVKQEGACLAWGGSVNLSPADDILIHVERVLDIDSEGQLVPSILSKKLAAGSTHVLIDIPVGPTAKIRDQTEAQKLAKQLVKIGKAVNLKVKTLITDGTQPIGYGIGPALEMRDVLAVLQNEKMAPQDLRMRALVLAGKILEMGGKAKKGQGYNLAMQTLDSGLAFKKFVSICKAQGGMTFPKLAKYQHEIKAHRSGIFAYINNRFIAKLAKLAGAPTAKMAGLDFHVKLGQKITKGDVIFTIHAEAPGELQYALTFLKNHPNEIRIEHELI